MLQTRPYGRAHMTQGHCGWLFLQCLALSSIAPCRFIPARPSAVYLFRSSHARSGGADQDRPGQAPDVARV
jgi:hypothetical protein